MLMDGYAIDFQDLLGLRKLNEPGLDRRAFTDWAENQISTGNESSNLLILASLGLDKEISKDEVFRYFDGYVDEIGEVMPTERVAFILAMRLTFKKLAYSELEDDVWSELTRTFVKWYDLPNGLLYRVMTYWSALHDDFTNNYEYEVGYYYLNYPRHGDIPRSKQLEYVRNCAIRFLRIFDEHYYFGLLIK